VTNTPDKKIDFHADMEKEENDFFNKLKTDHALGSNRELMKFLRLLLEGKIDMFQTSKVEEIEQRTSMGEPTTQTEKLYNENLYKKYVVDSGEPLVTEAQAKQIATLKEKESIKTEEEEKRQISKQRTERMETEELIKRKRLKGQGYQKPSVDWKDSEGYDPFS